tara:strand:+ start:12065 stop:12940 length:876 start_codon:yes stop_codon:yes gene_type:complete
LRSQLADTASKIVREDESAVLLLGDIGVYAFRDLLKEFPLRAYNIGILEQSTIGLAAGLSLTGHHPIVHTIAPFLVERAYEQIKVDLAYQQLGANLISVGSSYDYAGLGCTHHCPGDVEILNKIPNIEIVIPGHSKEFDKLLMSNYNNSNTTYFRLSETSNREDYPVEFGKNLVLKEGDDLTIVAVGPILQSVLDATEDLDVTIIYCTTIKPFDASYFQELKDKVVIVEPYYSGSILNNIEQTLHGLNGNYTNIGVPNEFIRKYGIKEDIDSMIGLDTASLRKKILDKINE